MQIMLILQCSAAVDYINDAANTISQTGRFIMSDQILLIQG